MSLETDIRDLVIDVAGYPDDPAGLTPERQLLDEEILDSQGIFELVEVLEDTYGIEIDEDEIVAESFETLAAIQRLVESKRVVAT